MAALNGGDSATSRTIDVELGVDVISVDLDNLDPDASDILDLLREAESPVWIWVRFASEYWRKGHLTTAEDICQAAIQVLSTGQKAASLWPVYTLKANMQLAYARKAPKLILPGAKRDIISDGNNKESHHKEATVFLNKVEMGRESAGESVAFQMLSSLTRSLYQLSEGALEDAIQGFESILSNSLTNIPALLGKARVHFARREYALSLGTFQKVLLLSPLCKPDPRIGIGLCLWHLNSHERAVAAWERSLEVNPGDWASSLILGLEGINRSKDIKRPDQDRAKAYQIGSKRIEKAFKANNKSAAAANALSEFFLRKGDLGNSHKLAERCVQYADTKPLLCDGHLRIARVFHAESQYSQAAKHYQLAGDNQNRQALPSLGLAQMQLQSEEVAAAIHTLDTFLQNSRALPCLEATIMLASLRANPRRGVSSAEVTQDKKRAREMFDQILRTLEGSEQGDSKIASTHRLGEDMDMYLEIAKLWQQDNTEKVARALKEALRIAQTKGNPDPRLVNNLAALKHMDGDLDLARSMYEDALRMASTSEDKATAEAATTILYNLARIYEAQDEVDLARGAYDKLLQRHPEYVDARIRQAQIMGDLNQINDAHEILKQALVSQGNNLNLRAYYTYFLLQSNLMRPAKDFVFATLKDHDKHDLYSLCSAGYIMYQQARESRDVSPEGLKTRRRTFERSVDLYEKALSLDPTCAIAAQGLAIATAEDALGSFGMQSEDPHLRLSDAREALDIFAKVRETISDGSIYSNMGHCYYTRDEFDRAIESYETASRRFYNQQNISVLLYLSRSHYAKAAKDQNYAHMGHALKYAQKALHLNPHDKAIVYNVAMIQQKAAEMLFAMDASKRSLPDLKMAIEHAEHAQRLFSSLASDKASALPYNREIADQRRKYGEVMLRKTEDHLAAQEAHEAEVQEKMNAARQRRQEERDRVTVLEQERAERLQLEAARLADERRKAREEAMSWTAAAKAAESDEEREKKVKRPRKEKAKPEAVSGDDVSPEEPKKKKRGKLKKADQNGDTPKEEEEELFSGGEDEKPKKRVSKKRVVRDEDEEDAAAPRKKLIKSKETISDSDEDME